MKWSSLFILLFFFGIPSYAMKCSHLTPPKASLENVIKQLVEENDILFSPNHVRRLAIALENRGIQLKDFIRKFKSFSEEEIAAIAEETWQGMSSDVAPMVGGKVFRNFRVTTKINQDPKARSIAIKLIKDYMFPVAQNSLAIHKAWGYYKRNLSPPMASSKTIALIALSFVIFEKPINSIIESILPVFGNAHLGSFTSSTFIGVNLMMLAVVAPIFGPIFYHEAWVPLKTVPSRLRLGLLARKVKRLKDINLAVGDQVTTGQLERHFDRSFDLEKVKQMDPSREILPEKPLGEYGMELVHQGTTLRHQFDMQFKLFSEKSSEFIEELEGITKWLGEGSQKITQPRLEFRRRSRTLLEERNGEFLDLLAKLQDLHSDMKVVQEKLDLYIRYLKASVNDFAEGSVGEGRLQALTHENTEITHSIPQIRSLESDVASLATMANQVQLVLSGATNIQGHKSPKKVIESEIKTIRSMTAEVSIE